MLALSNGDLAPQNCRLGNGFARPKLLAADEPHPLGYSRRGQLPDTIQVAHRRRDDVPRARKPTRLVRGAGQSTTTSVATPARRPRRLPAIPRWRRGLAGRVGRPGAVAVGAALVIGAGRHDRQVVLRPDREDRAGDRVVGPQLVGEREVAAAVEAPPEAGRRTAPPARAAAGGVARTRVPQARCPEVVSSDTSTARNCRTACRFIPSVPPAGPRSQQNHRDSQVSSSQKSSIAMPAPNDKGVSGLYRVYTL